MIKITTTLSEESAASTNEAAISSNLLRDEVSGKTDEFSGFVPNPDRFIFGFRGLGYGSHDDHEKEGKRIAPWRGDAPLQTG